MHLLVTIPDSSANQGSTVRLLARLAPVFRVEWRDQERVHVAEFPHLPQHLESAVRLLSEAVNIPNVQAVMNGRLVQNLTQFLSTLLCYRDSLGEEDKQAYCDRRAGRVSEAAGCPVWTCQARCPFICVRCLQITQEAGAPPVSEQLRRIAIKAEMDWCPNLRLP